MVGSFPWSHIHKHGLFVEFFNGIFTINQLLSFGRNIQARCVLGETLGWDQRMSYDCKLSISSLDWSRSCPASITNDKTLTVSSSDERLFCFNSTCSVCCLL